MYVTSGAQGEGFATVASDDGVLDAWFLNPKLAPGGAKAGTQRVTGLSLPGQSAFWRNSQTGALEAIARKKTWGALNAQLHATAGAT